MKSIKNFKYKKAYEFIVFVGSCGYNLDNVKGFDLVERKRCEGNILKEYCIHFNDGECANFKVVYFKSFNDFRQAHLNFSGNKLFDWLEDSNIFEYKTKGF